MRLRGFVYVKHRDDNSTLKSAMEMEDRWPVGSNNRPKKSWSKLVEEGMRKLNIAEDMAEDRQ